MKPEETTPDPDTNCQDPTIEYNSFAVARHCILNVFTQDELRKLRAIINGKLSKRVITPEQQAKMQAARQKVI